ncbi:unnamed protein product [Merluccius merluccius]
MTGSAVLASVSVCLSVLWLGSLGSGSLVVNSNAIKNLAPGPGPGTPDAAGSSPDEFGPSDGGHHNLLIDPIQALSCSADEQCGDHGYCGAPRGACLPCRRRRKRCARDAMCCPGNQCSNGVCLPMDADIVQQFTVEEMEPSATASSTASSHGASSHGASSHGASLEGERCLRSTDCSEGLCCARHFWSKICKPVLREGQVCTKHRKKGALGLEIFQRCDCGAGLACRTQRGAEDHRMHKAIRTLHTCQRH